MASITVYPATSKVSFAMEPLPMKEIFCKHRMMEKALGCLGFCINLLSSFFLLLLGILLCLMKGCADTSLEKCRTKVVSYPPTSKSNLILFARAMPINETGQAMS